MYAALAKFGAPIEALSASDFAEPDNFFRMGTPPVMVDIMPKISGVEFEEAWRRRVDVRIDDDLTVPFISREDLLVARVSAGRAQDLLDVDALRERRDGRHTPGGGVCNLQLIFYLQRISHNQVFTRFSDQYCPYQYAAP